MIDPKMGKDNFQVNKVSDNGQIEKMKKETYYQMKSDLT